MTKRLTFVIEKFIIGTPRKGFVRSQRVVVCSMPHRIKSKLKIKDKRLYISTKSLKHIYDSRKRVDFAFIVANFNNLITKPLGIYENKTGKTGSLCIYTQLKNNAFFTILNSDKGKAYVVSVYKLSGVSRKRRNYLAGYKLLWSRKGDLPSS